MAYYDRIKEARLALGLTQDQVAQQIGVAKSTFTGYEKGTREPNMLTLSKIMEVLHIDANYLFQDEACPSPTSPEPELDENIKKYLLLNAEGKKKAGERIDELLELPKYQARDKNGFTPDQLRRFAAGMDEIAKAVEIICEDSKAGSMLFNMSKGKR